MSLENKYLIKTNSYNGLNWYISSINHKTITEVLLGLYKPKDITHFFNKSLVEAWPKDGDILDIDRAVSIITEAIIKKQKIGIVGDYDVDGSSATGMLILFFREIDIDFFYHIPNRFSEGYGISMAIIQKLIDENVDVIITVDNGTTAVKEVAYAQQMGKKFIIIDHHHLQEPNSADAFINPHRKPTGFENMCAAGLVLVFLFHLNKYLFENRIVDCDIDVLQYIDIAAVATICDVMTLTGINRAIVADGLKKLNINPIPGYKFILQDHEKIDTQTVGFSLGPCINAPGRLHSAAKAVDLIIEKDLVRAKTLAEELVYMNVERREIEKNILQMAEEQVLTKDFTNKKSIVVCGDWFDGVIGIIAGRLKDRYQKPVCVLTKNSDILKGSLRSVAGFHIGNMVKNAIENKIATLGGGHEMAGGISLEESQLQNFINFFEQEVQRAEIQDKTFLDIDGIISLQAMESVYQIMQDFGPFGNGHREPLFLFPNCIIYSKKTIKTHCLLTLCSQNFKNYTDLWLFNPEEKILQTLVKDAKIHIVGYINKNRDKLNIKPIDFLVC